MSRENQTSSQQASQPQTSVVNGQKQSPNQPINNKQTQKTEDTENYNGLGRVTTNTPAFFRNPTTSGKLVEFVLNC